MKSSTHLITNSSSLLFRDHKALSMCGDIMFMRKNMMKELRQIIEANPVFRGKLKYPSIKSHRLNNLINQR